MNIKIVAALLFLFLSFSSYLKADGFYSYSLGKFDSNGYSDRYFSSYEGRFEYLSNCNAAERSFARFLELNSLSLLWKN